MEWASIEEVDKAVAGQTIPRQFLRTVAANKDLVALRSMDADGGWHEWTFGEYADYAARAAAGLRSLGLVAGDKVVLMMRNRPEFHALDMAAQFLRVVPISIYNSSSVEEIAYLTGHCEAKAAIVEDMGFLEKFLKIKGELPLVRHLVVMEPVEDVSTEVHTLESLLAHEPLDLAELAEETSPDDLATMIYTSGTTGPPKAVMLDQYNVVFTVESLRRTIVFTDYAGKKLISYLPMAHIAERMVSHYQQAVLGFTVTCCPDFSQIATYAREVHPNVLFGVPRVWEKIYAGVNAVLAGDPERKAKFDDAIAAAIPIVAKKAWGDGDEGGARDVGLPRRGRVQHRARPRRSRRARPRGHRRRADGARDLRVVPGDRCAARRGVRHVRELGPDDVHDRQGEGGHGRRGDPGL